MHPEKSNPAAICGARFMNSRRVGMFFYSFLANVNFYFGVFGCAYLYTALTFAEMEKFLVAQASACGF
jgi:hypothetical protein